MTPDEHKKRCNPADVERQELHDQSRANIGTQHHCERGHQIDKTAGGKTRRHQPGRGAALQNGGDAEPSQESSKAIA